MKIILPFISNTLMNFVIGLLLARFLGPAEYGRLALALAVGQVIQTLMFDWLRLAATRFYSERARLESPELRATLDASFAVLIAALSAATIFFLLSGIDVPLSRSLIGLAVGAAVANGLFDYNTALVRARFMDGLYARIIMGNMLYQIIPLVDRALIAQRYGFAESGQFSLAYDLGIRIVLAVGSTLDVLLFQIAVRADENHGADHSSAQIGRNMGVVIAVLAPTCVGAWLVMPSFQHLVVPPEFRGPFAEFFTYLLPGFFCYPLIHYAVHPVFQIRKRTKPLIVTASLAAFTNVALSVAMPAGAGAIGYAVALSGALGIGLLALICAATLVRAAWPAPRDIVVTLLGALAMAVVLLPLRDMTPGLSTLLLQVTTGTLVYGGFVLAFDLAGLRTTVLAHLPQRWRRRRPPSVPDARPLPRVDHVV